MSKLKLKLGTRKSLLAWAQSSWVARQVEALNPGVQVELVGIETRGDRIQDVSLMQVQGKEFFVAEIDHALRAKEVDLTVHSMKDLSLDRPSDFVTGAIPRRENPRDVILFGPQAYSRLMKGEKIKIGTSSPRRLENIPTFLKQALPRGTQGEPQVQCVEIRGNVNTRLSRVHETLESTRYLDGVVLAFAGLIRLWADAQGQAELQKLLTGVRWMVLPLRECPAAAAQGALAVECRAEDQQVYEMLQKLHDKKTAHAVGIERKLLEDWGGGCHQRFGATALATAEFSQLFFVRGVKPNGQSVDELRWVEPAPFKKGQSWDGSAFRKASEKALEERRSFSIPAGRPIFVAHSRAWAGTFSLETRVWTSGVASWFKLASQGVWVEGCAEGMGFDFLQSTLSEPVLQLPELKQWIVLTHSTGLDEWKSQAIEAVSTYQINSVYRNEAKDALKNATHVFWSSGSQFDELKEYAASHAQHACGPGKTKDRLRKNGIEPLVFPSVKEWRKWIQISE